VSSDDDEILGLYQWQTGTCFRCARAEVDTMRLQEITTRAGVCYDVRACRGCILVLEAERRRIAERQGRKYTPGQLGS
jgi:hypothetical protein